MLESGNQQLNKENKNFDEILDVYHSNSVWQALHALITVRPLSENQQKIAKIFDVSLEDIVEAIEGLITLGLVVYETGAYKAKKQSFIYRTQKEDLVQGHKDQAREIINRFSINKGLGANYHFSSNKEHMNRFRQEFSKLVKTTLIDKGNVNPDGIYGITMTAVNFIGDLNSTKEAL